MNRSALTPACLALTAALALPPLAAFAQSPAAANGGGSAAASPADAKPFLGDWTIAGESQMGPFAMALSIKVEEGKVVGSLSSEVQAPTVITDIVKSGDSLVMRYAFDYQGNAVPSVVTLTPRADKVDAHFVFADGAFEMGGVGSKTPAP